MNHRYLSIVLLCTSFALLQGCKSPSGSPSGMPVPQIPGVPKTSIPGIPSIPTGGSSSSIPGSPGLPSLPGLPGGKPGGKPGGEPGGEPGGDKNGKKGGSKKDKQGDQTAGVPGAPGGGGSGGPSNNPNGNTPEQGDDWLGGDDASGDDQWATSNTLPGGKGSDQTGASDPLDGTGDNAGSGGELDKALDTALEDFDGEILAERDAILKRNQRAASTSDRGGRASGQQGSQGGAGGSGQSGSGNGKAPPNPNDRTYKPDTRPPPNTPTTSKRGDRIIPDTPDATDEDVFARQLREAAVNEADPELKEKLWEEYRRYKGSS